MNFSNVKNEMVNEATNGERTLTSSVQYNRMSVRNLDIIVFEEAPTCMRYTPTSFDKDTETMILLPEEQTDTGGDGFRSAFELMQEHGYELVSSHPYNSSFKMRYYFVYQYDPKDYMKRTDENYEGRRRAVHKVVDEALAILYRDR